MSNGVVIGLSISCELKDMPCRDVDVLVVESELNHLICDIPVALPLLLLLLLVNRC